MLEQEPQHLPIPESDKVPALPDQPSVETEEQVMLPLEDPTPRKKKVRMCGSTGPTLDSRQTWCEKKNGHLGECDFTGSRDLRAVKPTVCF